MSVSDEFERLILDPQCTERDAHAFLKQYPYVLIQLFNQSWNFYAIVSEFRLGGVFRSDFAIISANSCCWEVVFVELEGPNDRLYTNKGVPNAKLNWAIRQTNDWRVFVGEHRSAFRSELARIVEPYDTYAHKNLMGKGVPGHVEIENNSTYIDYEYCVVMGNSRNFSESDRKAHGSHRDRVVATYDRVLNTMRDLESRWDNTDKARAMLTCTGKYDPVRHARWDTDEEQ
jgi:hypothetical protein